MIESRTAVKHGWGSMPRRWVSGLTPEERLAVKDGVVVYFRIHPWHWKQSGYKVVTYAPPKGDHGGRWDSREPSEEELAELNKTA